MMEKKILITAPEEYARRFAEALTSVSDNEITLRPVVMSLITTDVNTDVSGVLADCREYDFMAFTSRKAIMVLRDLGIKVPSSVGCLAIGRDNEALQQIGVQPFLIADEPSPMGIVEALRKWADDNGVDLSSKRIAVLGPRVEGLVEPDTVPNFLMALREVGLKVDFVAAYSTRPASSETLSSVRACLRDGVVDCVAFTSATEAQVFGRIMGEGDMDADGNRNHVVMAAFGPYTAQCIRNEGMKVDFVSNKFSSFVDFGRNLREYFMTFAKE